MRTSEHFLDVYTARDTIAEEDVVLIRFGNVVDDEKIAVDCLRDGNGHYVCPDKKFQLALSAESTEMLIKWLGMAIKKIDRP